MLKNSKFYNFYKLTKKFANYLHLPIHNNLINALKAKKDQRSLSQVNSTGKNSPSWQPTNRQVIPPFKIPLKLMPQLL